MSDVATAATRCCADQVGCTARPTTKPTSRSVNHGWNDGYPSPKPTKSYTPSHSPSPIPTHVPTHLPTQLPSREPTPVPVFGNRTTFEPTHLPTDEPIPLPTPSPTRVPTRLPTPPPTPIPSPSPTHVPSHLPTPYPTKAPTPQPTHVPAVPTNEPSADPTRPPTRGPTHSPTRNPTPLPTEVTKTLQPSYAPTHPPTPMPSHIPTTKTIFPTHIPTTLPTLEPTPLPTLPPTDTPTPLPSALPTEQPTKRSLCSELTCTELGWDGFRFGHGTVCGGSEITQIDSVGEVSGSGCFGGVPTFENGERTNGLATFDEAREFCQSAGARLCEAYELLADDARDSGCQLNGELVWSGTPCANNQRNYYVTYGSTDGDRLNGAFQGDDDGPNGPKQHNKPVFGLDSDNRECHVAIGEQGTNVGAELFHVRCCADVDGQACSPSQVPTRLPSPSPTSVPTVFPTSSPPTEVPTAGPTALSLSCNSPAAFYTSIMRHTSVATRHFGDSTVKDWTCTEIELSEAPGNLAQRMCNFSPEHCDNQQDWQVCSFSVRSSTLVLYTPPSYSFKRQPDLLFCTDGCRECLAK